VALLETRPEWDALIDPSTEEARTQAARLRDVYKLDPARMKEVDARYGPFDWRLPEAHAVYWAFEGIRQAGDRDVLPLRRVIWQAMNAAFLRGRLFWNEAEDRMESGPNLDLIENVDRAFEEMKEAEPEKVDYIGRAQRNFLGDAVYFLYTHNQSARAAQWLARARQKFAGFANFIDQGVPDKYDISFTGAQFNFTPPSKWTDDDSPGFGASYGDFETTVIPGNTFDYPFIHGKSIREAGFSFVSVSDEAVTDDKFNLSDYKIIDLNLKPF